MGWPVAFALTLAVEVPIVVGLLRAFRLLPALRALGVAAGINAMTHPILWVALSPEPTAKATALAELAVCVTEAAVLSAVVRRDLGVLAGVSLTANAASAGVGLLVGLAIAG